MSNRVKKPDAQVAMMNFIGRENNFVHFQYEKEMLQYQMMKAGEDGAAEESHRMMLQGARNSKLADDPVTNMKYLFICNATLMTRFAIEGGLDSETAYNTSDLYIYNMNKCVTVDEVLDLAFGSQSHFTEAFRKKNGVTPKQFRDREYRHHISR